MTLCRFVFLPLLTTCAFGQPPLTFEVATIKPSAPNAISTGVPRPNGTRRISIQGMNLRGMIYYAYGNGLSTAMQVRGGPDWSNQTRYDIQAQAPNNATVHEFQMMFRTLLEERFALKLHKEEKPIDVYALELARSDGKLGPKVQEWDGTCGGRQPLGDDDPMTPRCAAGFRPPGMFLEGVTMFAVAEMLSLPQARGELGRIVQDRTGLTGRYQMELEFQFAPPRALQPGAPPDSSGPSLLTAVREQWGLKLEPAKGSLEVLMVESAQLPTEN